MNMRSARIFSVMTLTTILVFGAPATRTLDVYVLDAEGGKAMLVVSPSGESLLFDVGFPEGPNFVASTDRIRITAIDLDRGDILWQIAHGETPDNVRNHPALKGLNIPSTGRGGVIGILVTKTLAIAREGGFFTTPSGARGAMLRAYDKATGKEVGAVYMPAPQSGSPMTYMVNGEQFIVVAVSGGSYSPSCSRSICGNKRHPPAQRSKMSVSSCL
jgi:hypothetical protein